MKTHIAPNSVLWICGLLCLAFAGQWVVRRHAAPAAPGLASVPSAAAAALPPPVAGNSATDRFVAKWAAAVQRDSANPDAWVSLGDGLMQKARETADLSYYGHAERAYAKALALSPDKVSALNGMAWVNSGRHEFEKSIEWATRAIALDARDNDAYGLLGDADVEMGNYDLAYTHYQKMLDIRPDTSSYSRGAHLLHLTGNLRKAVWLMVKAIDAGAPYAENTGWCRTQLALMLLSNGNLVAAEQTLQAALKLTPHNYQVLAALGKVKAARKEYPAAIDYYRRSLAIVPQHDSLVALGDLYRLTGKPDEAEKQYALVETVHTLQKANGVRGDVQIAQFYADHGRRLADALAMAEEEFKTRKNVYAADTLAWCYYQNGRYAEAKAAIRQALSQHTPEALFEFHAGMIYAKLGDRLTAQLCLSHALSLNPNFSPVYAPVAAATLAQLGARPPGPKLASAR